MTAAPLAGSLELLRRLAETNPLVLEALAGEHEQIYARVTYLADPASASAESEARPSRRSVTETVTVARGFGAEPGSIEAICSARELARAATRAYACRTWSVPAAGGHTLVLGQRPLVMGILNVTADSFSDGGQWLSRDAAVARGLEMIEAGVDWIDVGGESTRPGASPVSVASELERVLPVVQALAAQPSALVSIDTSKAAVAREALAAGAAIVNDVTALEGDPEMGRVVAEAGAALVLMHMQGTPRTMQEAPVYDDVTREVAGSLRWAMVRAAEAGIAPEAMLVDPGIGFGKTLEHNLTLLRRLEELCSLGRPVLLGASRKAFLGQLLGLPVGERDQASVICHALGALRGAAVVRVHDVASTALAMRLAGAFRPTPAD